MSLLLSLRQPLRSLRRSPGFFAATLLLFALGVGGTTALCGLVRHHLLRPLPYADPGRLVSLQETRAGRAIPVGPADFLAWAGEAPQFEGMAAFRSRNRELTLGANPVPVHAVEATPGFFEALGYRAVLGSFPAQADGQPSAEPTVVLGERLWRDLFQADPGVLGRTLQVSGIPARILGVAPDGFVYPSAWSHAAPQVFTTLRLSPESRTAHQYEGIARLRSGVSLAQAQTGLDAIQARRSLDFPDSNAENGALLKPLRAYLSQGREGLSLLVFVASLLYLMACLNVASLFLARALTKAREAAVRAALGAGLQGIASPFLAEGLLCAAAGLLGACLLAGPAMGFLTTLLPEARLLGGGRAPGVDLGLAGFGLGLSLLGALGVSASPVLLLRFRELSAWLKEGDRGSSPSAGRLRGALLALELALTTLALGASSLMLSDFTRLLRRDLGFRVAGVAQAELRPASGSVPDDATLARVRKALMAELAGLPGVEGVGLTTHGPHEGSGTTSRIRLGISEAPGSRDPEVPVFSATEGYLEALGIPLVAGRALRAGDTVGAPAAVLVNQAFARRFWPDRNAVGQWLRTSYLDEPVQVVGVFKDFRFGGFGAEPRPVLMYAFDQNPNGGMGLYLRTRLPLRDQRALLEAAAARAAVPVHITGPAPLARGLAEGLSRQRNAAVLLGALTLLLLSLAAAGTSSVVGYAVAQRRREIAVRMVLGARPGPVMARILRAETVWAAGGIGAGLLASLGATRVLKAALPGFAPSAPWSLLGSTLVMVLAALAASLLPVLRAARMAPAEVLRSE